MARVRYHASKRYDHRLARIAKSLPKVADKIVSDSVDDGVKVGTQLCPKDTTRLSKTVRKTRKGPAHYVLEAGNMVGFDGVFVDYAFFVELEQPFLHPAMQIVRQNLVSRMRSAERLLLG